MRSLVTFSFRFALLALLVFSTVENASAIPAFARKYQISCQVCHAPAMPRLKAFGAEFAGNGFRLTEYESPRYFIQAGDDRLNLLRELPLAIRLDGFASYNMGEAGTVDFSSPFVLKILSGGEISDKLSYYFYFLLNERGSIAGVEDAFLMYNDAFGTGVNFYIGQFQVSDPLFKGELRYTLEPYRIYGTKPGRSTADMKYDRGIILEKELSTGTTLLAQVLNGCGIGEASKEWLFDKDKYKSYMGRINQSFGKYLTIGFFGYTGKEVMEQNLLTAVNNLTMFGPDLTFNYDDKLILGIQYMLRKDSEVLIEGVPAPVNDIDTKGGFAELTWSPKGDMSKWYLTGLYNTVDSELDELDYSSATMHFGYLVRRNLRFVTEYTQIIDPVSYGKVSAGFVTAF